jgi:hypothetical protein
LPGGADGAVRHGLPRQQRVLNEPDLAAFEASWRKWAMALH